MAIRPKVDGLDEFVDAFMWQTDPEALRRSFLTAYRKLNAEAQELQRQALRDPLTGLANRVLLEDRLETALQASRRNGDPLAVLLMDLDRFKEINDTSGHHAGDVVLREVAVRFRIALRGQDTAARIGGDEFAAVLPGADTAGALRAAQRVLRALADAIPTDEGTFEVGASIGIAVYPDNGADAAELLDHADQAMYRAKGSGGGYALFAPAADFSVHARVARGSSPRRRPSFRLLIGFAAALAILSGAMTPAGHRRAGDERAAARLQAAVVAVEQARFDQMEGVVADVELTIGSIPLQEVRGAEVVAALGKLEQTLGGMDLPGATQLDGRVQRLITTIHAAATVAATHPEDLLPIPKP